MKKQQYLDVDDVAEVLQQLISNAPDIQQQRAIIEEIKSLQEVHGMIESDAVAYVVKPSIERFLEEPMCRTSKH